MAVQECLLPAGNGDPVHGPARVGQPEREQETLGALAGQVHPDIAEVDLRVQARTVVADHEPRCWRRRSRRLGHLPASAGHVVPHRCVGDLRPQFLPEPVGDPLNGVPLLGRCGQILAQPLVDRLLVGLQPRRLAAGRLAGLRQRRGERFTHQPPMHLVLPRQRTDRQALPPGIPADHQEQLFPRGRHPASPPSWRPHPSVAPPRTPGATSSRNNP